MKCQLPIFFLFISNLLIIVNCSVTSVENVQAEECMYDYPTHLEDLVWQLSRSRACLDHRADDTRQGLHLRVLFRALRQHQRPLEGTFDLSHERHLRLGAVVAGGYTGDDDACEGGAVLVS